MDHGVRHGSDYVGGIEIEQREWKAGALSDLFEAQLGPGFLPETLHPTHRQPFEVGHLMRGYSELLSNRRFLLLAFASGVPFNGLFLC